MSTEHKRRNSLERYQPRKPLDNDDELAPSLDKLSLNSNDGSFEAFSKDNSYKPSGRNNRRGVNSHLYANSRGGGERGGGRGRGRGRCQDGGRAQSHFNSVNDERQGDNNHSLNQNKGQHASWSKGENENKQHHNNVTYTPYQHGRQQRNDIPTNNYSNTPRIKNTENFKPSHKPTDMRILTAHSGWKKYEREIQSRDVMIVHDLFCQPSDLSIYEKLLGEIKSSGIDQEDLWKLWHGDSHVIADDKKRWKDSCPTFHMVLDRIQEYFDMDIEATRLNWYRDSREWKPFHHDAAAIKPDKAKTQNLTVAVSFGAERDAAFEHATTKTVISMPQPNGTIYVFAKDVNVIWRHGILQVAPEKYHDQGRVSIIAWGWAEQTQV